MMAYRRNNGSIEAAIAVLVVFALFVAGLVVAGAARKVVRERRESRPSETTEASPRAASAEPAMADSRPADAPAEPKQVSRAFQSTPSAATTTIGRIVPFSSGTAAGNFSALPEQTQPRYGGIVPFPRTSISSAPSSVSDPLAHEPAAPIVGGVVPFPTSAVPPNPPQNQQMPQGFVSFLYESLLSAQAEARDERKRYELNQFASALEAYYFDFETYPASLFDLTSAGYTRAVPTVPSLATGGRNYGDYYYRESADSYSLCIPLETSQSWFCTLPVQH